MATISDLRGALMTARASFKTMRRMCWSQEPIVRSTYFAQTQVECDGEQLLVAMPLSSLSLRRVERFIPLKRHLISAEIPVMRILREEMRCERAAACDIYCEVLQPDTLPFGDALAGVACNAEAEALVEALDALQEQLLKADVSHNNVAEKNLVIDARGRLHLIRWYYATQGAGGDREAFGELRERILSGLDEGLLREPCGESYSALPVLEGHLSVRPMREGLAAVEDSSGWGFVDSENRAVVEAKYIWVNDFYEGRAEVESTQGMGLIDKQGAYIVEPRYSIVEYDRRSGRSKVLDGEEWFEVDYSGQRLEDKI